MTSAPYIWWREEKQSFFQQEKQVESLFYERSQSHFFVMKFPLSFHLSFHGASTMKIKYTFTLHFIFYFGHDVSNIILNFACFYINTLPQNINAHVIF